jgi:hypothetical protein
LKDGRLCQAVPVEGGRCRFHAGYPSGKLLWFRCPNCDAVVQAQRMLGPPADADIRVLRRGA